MIVLLIRRKKNHQTKSTHNPEVLTEIVSQVLNLVFENNLEMMLAHQVTQNMTALLN